MSIPTKTAGRKSPAVSISKKVYTMAAVDNDSAEITMYGDIYEEQPTNWWGDPVEGQFVLLTEFLEDLKQISGCKSITIRMNSYGGDAGASNMIHNRLRELARCRNETDLHRGRRGHERRQPYHVRLRYGEGQSLQPHYDPQVLAVPLGRL